MSYYFEAVSECQAEMYKERGNRVATLPPNLERDMYYDSADFVISLVEIATSVKEAGKATPWLLAFLKPPLKHETKIKYNKKQHVNFL